MKTGFSKRLLRVLSAALAILLLSCCNRVEPVDPDPDQEPPYVDPSQQSLRGAQVNEDGIKIDMPATSVLVKDDLNDHLLEYDPKSGQLVFETCATVDQAGIKEGDVLFSGVIAEKAPDGYLVKVLGINRTSTRTVLNTEPAGLQDAFNDLSIDFSPGTLPLSEENITVYDPFKQEDLTPAEPDPMTRGLSMDLDFTKDDFFKLDINKYKLTVGTDHSSLEIVIFDGDEKYDTKNDQARLVFEVNYDFESGTLDLNKDGVSGHTEVGLVMNLGGSAGFHYKPKLSGELNDISFIEKNFSDFKDEVEKKLMKKKVRVATWEFPLEMIPKIGPVLAAIFSLRLDLYFKMDIDVKGDVGIDLIFEPYHIDAHWENRKQDISENDSNSCWLKVTDGGCHSEFMADADLKGTAGVGSGIVLGFKKMVEFLVSEKGEKPYAGFFLEAGNVLDLKFKSSWDTRTNKLIGTLTGKDYFETEGYAEVDVRFKNGLMWKNKLGYPALTWKIPDIPLEKTWDFELNFPVPVPFLTAPQNQAIVQEKTVNLQWNVSPAAFMYGRTYSVYCHTDKALVQQGSPRALIAKGLETTEQEVAIDPMQTYYWKVVATTDSGHDFESLLYYFDTGYDGMVMLNEPLMNFLKDNWTVLDGVRIESDGRIYRTPSNKKALSEIRELDIQDPEGKYGIYTLDDLLAHLPSLETLICNHNDIRIFDFSHNPRMVALACRDNSLMSLDLSELPNLEGLNCSENEKLTELDLTQCPNLKTLYCEKCKISRLDLSRSQKLQDLFAAENALSELDISRCPNLLRLDVYSQSVERLKLRLTQAQKDGALAYLKPHVNTDYEIVGVSGIETAEATDVTNHSAVIKVSALDREPYTAVGVLYSRSEHTPDIHTELTDQMVVHDQLYASFTLEGLKPGTDYYARGFALNAGNMQYWYGNTVHFKTLPRDPVPEVSIEPDIVRFGEVNPWTVVSQDVTIRNVGEQDLTYEILYRDDIPFTVTPTEKRTLEPNDSQVITVSFAPWEAGDFHAMITVRSNDPRGDQYFDVRGTGAGDPAPDYRHVEMKAGEYRQLIPAEVLKNIPEGKTFYWKSEDDTIVAVDDESGLYAISSGLTYVYGRIDGEDRIRTEVIVSGVLPEYVDLGLPVKWATCNLGASMPYEVGNRYAWGETEPKESFSWDNYKWGTQHALTKYCYSSEYGKDGFTDNKWTLDLEDDAAYRLKGGNWRIPSGYHGLDVLSGARVSVNGESGVMLRGKDPEFSDRWIYFPHSHYSWINFLPGWASGLAGECMHTKWDTVGSYPGANYNDVRSREQGLPIRPVLLVPVTGVSLDQTELRLERGTQAYLTATVHPSDATDQKLVWSTGSNAVATVYSWDNLAEVYGKGPGITTVTATARDGGMAATCKISVIEYIFFLDMEDIPDVIVGESRNLKVTWNPEDATETELIWKSDDPSIATVSDGKVKGVKAGKTRIRAIVKTEAKGHIEASREVTVVNPGGSHEGYEVEHWD